VTPRREDALPEGEEKVRAVREMFDTIAPRYDLVNRVMTFGLDIRWRKRATRSLGLARGSVVLDIAAGTGDFCRELSSAGLVPIGVDLSFGMLANARTDAPLLQGDALRMPFPDAAADGATCGFALRNLRDLSAFVAELGRVVRPGGRIALLDVAAPVNPVLRWGHGIYFGKVVPRIGGALNGAGRDAYRYLPRSAAYLPEGDGISVILRAAGFADAERQLLSGGITQLLTGTRS
jgi:demethylmenaquinone methyltransferase/2-methoxy-6-polyprenyl-1,4-benzoquinol methylase